MNQIAVRLLTLCALSFFCLTASAQTPSNTAPTSAYSRADLAAALQKLKANTLSGHFQEEKSVSGFPKPLISRGVFCIDKDKIDWHTQKPFESRVLITREAIQFESAGTTQTLNAQQVPAIGQIVTLLTAVIAGDVSTLEKTFSLSFSQKDARVTVHAVPKDALLAHAVRSVTLAGTNYVEDVVLTDSRGDITHLTFTDIVKN